MNNEKELRHRYGWTPAPTKPPYSQTNVSMEHKGRDYDALLRAAKRKPVGYWEDAPRGMKFGGSDDKPIVKAADGPIAGGAPAAPTTPPADDEFEPVGTMPAVGDECVKVSHIQIAVGGHIGLDVGSRITITGPKRDSPFGEVFDHDRNMSGIYAECFKRGSWRILKRPTKPRDDVATGRVWEHEDRHAKYVEAPSGCYYYGRIGRWEAFSWPIAKECRQWTELFGPERDAILAECRKAMGL